VSLRSVTVKFIKFKKKHKNYAVTSLRFASHMGACGDEIHLSGSLQIPDPHQHQSDKLDSELDLHQFADDKP
jgi:hypothetical protein